MTSDTESENFDRLFGKHARARRSGEHGELKLLPIFRPEV